MARIVVEKGQPEEIIIRFPYDPTLVAKIKTIEGRRWNPLEKYWTVPITHGIIDVLTKTFAPEPLVVDSALKPAMVGGNGVESLDPEGAMIIDAVDNELKLRGYSPKTRKAYRGHIERFLRYYRCDYQWLGEKEARDYLLHLLEERKVSHAYVNQAFSAIKILVKDVFKKNGVSFDIPRPKKSRRKRKPASRKMCRFTHYGTLLPHTYWKRALICDIYRNCSGIKVPKPRRFTPMSVSAISEESKVPWTV